MTYTTQQLINLLQSEQEACVNGERLKLSATKTGEAKEADAILGTEAVQQIVSYHDYRTEVWKYQVQNLVSGIVWEEVELYGKLLIFPKIHGQLISLPSDLELMNFYKGRIIDFWRNATQGLQLWRSGDNREGKERPEMIITPTEAEKLITQCQWATLSSNTFNRQLRRWTLDPEPYYQEISIELGWGCPELAGYWQNCPEHGSEWITAVNSDATEKEE